MEGRKKTRKRQEGERTETKVGEERDRMERGWGEEGRGDRMEREE